MKKYFSKCLLLLALTGCTGNSDKKIREEAITVAAEYLKGQSKTPEKKIGDNGTVSIIDGETSYILDPSSLFTGFLDNDNRKDAILTVFSYYKDRPGRVEHLILINVNGKLTMQRAIENDMKILELKDGIITAEIHTHPKSSPLYNCPVCMEAVKFRYAAGELVKAE
ncbi:MAG: hypothetical protein ACM3UT_04590 [Chloroflexota bacterium]